MAFFQINSSELRRGSDNLRGLVQKFNSRKEELKSMEAEMISMWEGEAKEAFHQAFLKDVGQMEAFARVIENYSRVMINIADRYDATENRNMEIASCRAY